MRFVELAHQAARCCLPVYAHKYSPQRFTLPQWAACVRLKEYRQLDWRGIKALLELSPPLRRCLRLQAVPDYSTRWRFAQRWLKASRVGQCLEQVLRVLDLPAVNVAVDSTGPDPGRTSSYCLARRKTRGRRKRDVKVSLSVVVKALGAASAGADGGPCNDKVELPRLLHQTHQRLRVRELDAGSQTPGRRDGRRSLARAHGARLAAARRPALGRRKLHQRDETSGRPWLRSRHRRRQLREALLKVVAYSIHR